MTTIGGHYSESGSRVAPPPWSISLDPRGEGKWDVLRGPGGTSGALSTTVPKSWIEKLCVARGLK